MNGRAKLVSRLLRRFVAVNLRTTIPEAMVTDSPGAGRTAPPCDKEGLSPVAESALRFRDTAAGEVRSAGKYRPCSERRARSTGAVVTANQRVSHGLGGPTPPQGSGFAIGARKEFSGDAERAELANSAKPPDPGSTKNGGRPAAKRKDDLRDKRSDP
jgi:hypothetical protein